MGFRLISAAAVFYNPSAENLIVAGTVFGISELTARIEEKKMKIVYPQRYDDYAARVSRWMPKFSDIGTFTNEIKKYFSTIIRTPSKW